MYLLGQGKRGNSLWMLFSGMGKGRILRNKKKERMVVSCIFF